MAMSALSTIPDQVIGGAGLVHRQAKPSKDNGLVGKGTIQEKFI